MTILDDLFSLAAAQWAVIQGSAEGAEGVKVVVDAEVTLIPSSDLELATVYPSNVNPVETLTYAAGAEIDEGGGITVLLPASFSDGTLTITAPRVLDFEHGYEVNWGGNTFTPSVDGTTSVVYGALSETSGEARYTLPTFITISLGNFRTAT